MWRNNPGKWWIEVGGRPEGFPWSSGLCLVLIPTQQWANLKSKSAYRREMAKTILMEMKKPCRQMDLITIFILHDTRVYPDYYRDTIKISHHPSSRCPNGEKMSISENVNVSHMSKRFITDIVTGSQSDLPSLEECFLPHKFILSELLPHFNRLCRTNHQCCPVT